MNRPRRVNARERLKPTPELPYGPDPGDASVEHAYLKMQDEITLGIPRAEYYEPCSPLS